MESNIIEFQSAFNENNARKKNTADLIGEFKSTIITLQGMLIEMYATNENLPQLTANLFVMQEMFEYTIEAEKIEQINDLLSFKEAELEKQSEKNLAAA